MFKLKSLKATALVSAVAGITALSFTGIAIQMGHSNFKASAEKQLHILNSIRLSTIVQIGIEEQWVNLNDSSSTIVYLADIDNSYNVSSTLKNPSTSSQAYDVNSYVLIESNNNYYSFFVYLKEPDSDHIYIQPETEIHLLNVNDVSLAE